MGCEPMWTIGDGGGGGNWIYTDRPLLKEIGDTTRKAFRTFAYSFILDTIRMSDGGGVVTSRWTKFNRGGVKKVTFWSDVFDE